MDDLIRASALLTNEEGEEDFDEEGMEKTGDDEEEEEDTDMVSWEN